VNFTLEQDPTASCTLCGISVRGRTILDGQKAFCCTGCHAVHQILQVRDQLRNVREQPLFLQAVQAGLISNPQILEEIRRERQALPEGERVKFHIEVKEMWCPSCAEIIRLMLMRQKGVINCVIDYTTDFASIEFQPRMVSKEAVLSLINRLGYIATPLTIADEKPVSRDLYLRFGVAAFCAVNIMMLAYPLYSTYFYFDGEGYGLLFAWLSGGLALPVLLYSAWPIWRRLYHSLREGIMGMELLIAIGSTAAVIVSSIHLFQGSTEVYFDSLSALIAFSLLGKMIESKAKFSAKHSLLKLVRSSPRRGRKAFPDGSMAFVALKEVSKGDRLVVCPGEKIPLDGIVAEGEGACDESVMTGEVVPVVKKKGSALLAGTVLVQGSLTIQVTCGEEETALCRIMEMIEQGISHKAVYTRAADAVVRWFVPGVLSLAFLTGVIVYGTSLDSGEAFLRVLSLLLIACPCAIGIAAPTAESYLLNALSSLGVIVRNRGVLPSLGRETVLIFDKTGTVTEGRYQLLSGDELLSLQDSQAIGQLASRSNHPIACAISSAFGTEASLQIEAFEEVVGNGLRASIDGVLYRLGSLRFLKSEGIICREIAEHAPMSSCAYMAREGVFLGALHLGDRVRPGMAELIASLKPAKTLLLSGDGESTVASVARLCGFDAWHSNCTPFEKRQVVEQMKREGAVVCMVGDGVNDSLALTEADVGISVVSATDISIQVSDILLTTDRLAVISQLRGLGRFGQTLIKQNLFWAFAYNVIGIGLAMFGFLTPIFSAFAMSISSLTVLFNAKRLKSIQ